MEWILGRGTQSRTAVLSPLASPTGRKPLSRPSSRFPSQDSGVDFIINAPLSCLYRKCSVSPLTMSPACPHLFDSLGLVGVRFHLQKDCEGKSALNPRSGWCLMTLCCLQQLPVPAGEERLFWEAGGRTQEAGLMPASNLDFKCLFLVFLI